MCSVFAAEYETEYNYDIASLAYLPEWKNSGWPNHGSWETMFPPAQYPVPWIYTKLTSGVTDNSGLTNLTNYYYRRRDIAVPAYEFWGAASAAGSTVTQSLSYYLDFPVCGTYKVTAICPVPFAWGSSGLYPYSYEASLSAVVHYADEVDIAFEMASRSHQAAVAPYTDPLYRSGECWQVEDFTFEVTEFAIVSFDIVASYTALKNGYVVMSTFPLLDLNVERLPDPPSAEEEFRDEQRGFWQKVLDFLQGIWDAIKSIPETIAKIPQLIMDGLKFLFIPGDGAIQWLVEDFKASIEGNLGFVLQLDDLFKSFFQPLVAGGDGQDVVLILPKAELPKSYGGVTIWPDTPFNLSAVVRDSKPIGSLYTVYKILISVLLLGLLLRFLYRTAEDVLGERSGGG